MKTLMTLPVATGLMILLTTAGMTTATVNATVMQESGARFTVLEDPSAPQRGMSQHTVKARLGEPLKRTPPVGQPPISSWDYPGYTVYFEGPWVLHTVLHARP